MAAPQFATSKGKRSAPKKRFTVEQANRTLPLVSRIAADIVRTHKSAASLQQQVDKLGVNSNQRNDFEKQIERTMDRMGGLIEELKQVGCELKDFQIGLIDFIGKHQGRDVCLCWKLGETQIGFWHELDQGFSGRQPISLLEEKE